MVSPYGEGKTLRYRFARVLRFCAIALLTAGAFSACSLPGMGSDTPTMTPAQSYTKVPAGWQVYKGQHFTIAYPPEWSYSYQSPLPARRARGLS
jgi:hypothetical protein